MIPVVFFGAWQQHQAGNVRWRVAIAVGLASVVGVARRGGSGHLAGDDLLRDLFAAFLLVVAAQLVWSAAPTNGPT